MNDGNEKSIWPKVISILITIIVISPLIISVLSIWAKPLTFIEFDSSVWIGFWGSYLGGIIGTIGVIYVANLQNNKQREENEIIMAEQRELNQNQIDSQIDSLDKVEEFNRERLKIQTQISLLEKYLSIVANLRIDIDYFNDNVMKMISSYLTLKDLVEDESAYERKEDMKNLKTEIEVSWNNIKSIKKSHFLKSFKIILHQQLLLSSTDISFKEVSPDALNAFSSLDEASRFLDHYALHIEPFIVTRTNKIENYNYHLKSYQSAIDIVEDIDITAHSNISKLIKKLDK